MSDRYIGKDGLERDIAKLKYEWKIYKAEMAAHWERFRRDPKFHTATNLTVESCRASAYFFGHVVMIYATLNTVAWVVNFGLWAVVLLS